MGELVLASASYVSLVAHASKEKETPQQALDEILAFDAEMTDLIASGSMVQVMKEGENGVNVIGRDKLARYIAQGFHQVRFDEELANFVRVVPVAGS